MCSIQGATGMIATVDHSDIRGLGTTRHHFVAELPRSSCVGWSAQGRPLIGVTRVLLTGLPRPESSTLHTCDSSVAVGGGRYGRVPAGSEAVLHALSTAPRASNTGGAVGKGWRTAAHRSAQGSCRMGPTHHLAGDGPDEPHQLTGHRGGDLALRLARVIQMPIPRTQALLCRPGHGLHRRRCSTC